MRIEPLDALRTRILQPRPPLDAQRELEMHRAGVRDAHKHPPKHHAYACIEQMKKPSGEGGGYALEDELGGDVGKEVVQLGEEIL